MYRPDRIGPWKLGNLDIASLIRTDATLPKSSFTAYSTCSLNVALAIDVAIEHVVFSDLALSLTNGDASGIGVNVSGDNYGAGYLYSLAGSIAFESAQNVQIEAVIGMLAGAPSLLSPIGVLNPNVLPLDVFSRGGDSYYASLNQSLITAKKIPDTAPPLGIAGFFRIINNSGGAATIKGLTLNLSLHKYRSDLDTLDPSR